MTNEELQELSKAYIRELSAKPADLKVWASESYVASRRKGEMVTLLCQHDFMPDLWIVEHKDGTEGIYVNTEFARLNTPE